MSTPTLLQRRHLLLSSLAAAALSACGKKAPTAQVLPAGAAVLALGDSLTQGVGAKSHEAWPQLLHERTGWDVINEGISGHTSAQALQRLPDLLQDYQPALVVVCIGGNDFLRQMSAQAAKENIRRICQQVQARGAQVLLVAVPQLSLLAAGTGRLSDHPMYEELAKELNIALLPGAWSEILSKPQWRSDQVHANAEGYAQFTQKIVNFVREHGWLR